MRSAQLVPQCIFRDKRIALVGRHYFTGLCWLGNCTWVFPSCSTIDITAKCCLHLSLHVATLTVHRRLQCWTDIRWTCMHCSRQLRIGAATRQCLP